MINMKIAFNYEQDPFKDQWIEYCNTNSIDYKIVNCYKPNIIQELTDCDALMWHHSHGNYKDVLFAKQLLYSLEQSGKKVFPDFNTGWHFDDKVGQKYLFESIGAPLVNSYVFYTKKESLEWIESTIFPKVFKLRGGAGSSNVKLVRTKEEAIRIVKKAFGRGFPQFDRWGYFKERIRKTREGKDSIIGILKGIGRLFISTEFAKMRGREKGYVYFQDFIPNNLVDYRLNVINGCCYGCQRQVRKGDFRASGSGIINYSSSEIPIKMIQIAFDVSDKLKLQSVAFDFVIDNNKPLIIEMSYCFSFDEEDGEHGYWTSDLEFHKERFNPQALMIDDLISKMKG